LVGQPAKIGKYDVLRLIGRGGMGVVYEALDPKLERHVAIKMILGATPGLLARFDREARSTASLQHPNIVTIYEFGDQDGSPYLVMEYLSGMSLESALSSGQSLSLATKLSICIDVCNGLGYAHDRGIIHRDIKPANVMLLEDGTVKIVDFGIARMGETGISRTEIIGSLHYMSPEQFQNQPLDRRTDIFSTGVVLYQLLTGGLPFQATGGEAAVMYRIMHEDPAPLSSYGKDYPPQLDEIIRKVLAKNRDLRYASARELSFDLQAVAEEEKHREVVQWMTRAEVAVQRTEWTKAEEYLRQVLKVDHHHIPAHQLLGQVQARIRQQRNAEQLRELRTQADQAFVNRRYDEALRIVDQAIAIDATNQDLLGLRQSINEAKSRVARFELALRRAEDAQRAGDLEEAKLAIREALEIDPSETAAKALQVVILKQAEEQEGQQRLRTLFDTARDQITARNLTAALQTLKEAELLDPASVELYSLRKVVNAAREEQLRKSELEKLSREIEQALNRGDYTAATAIADEGLQRYPREQILLKLRALAEGQQQRVQLKAYARDQFLAATGLLEAGRAAQALSVIETARRVIPSDTQLESLQKIVEDRIALEEVEERQRQLLQCARELATAEKFDDAVRLLETLRRDFPGSEEIETLLEHASAAAKHAELVSQALALGQQLLDESSPEEAVQFLEHKTRELSDARLFDLLERARREREQFQSAMQTFVDEGKRILQQRGASEAAQYLAARPTKFRETPELRVLSEAVANRVAYDTLEQELERKSDPDAQIRLAEAALRENPRNEEIKQRLSAVRTRKERINEIVAKARGLEAAQQYSEAAQEWRRLSRVYPQYTGLESEIRRLERVEEQRLLESARREQERLDLLAKEEAEKRRQQALEATLSEGERILRERGARDALHFLDSQASEYRDSQQFRELHDSVRDREGLEALNSNLANEPNPDRRLQSAEEALRHRRNNRLIQQKVAELRQLKETIDGRVKRARGFESGKLFAEAMQEWQQLAVSYPKVSEFDAQVRRLASLLDSKEKVMPAIAEPRKSETYSATEILDLAVVREVKPSDHDHAVRESETAPIPESVETLAETSGERLRKKGTRVFAAVWARVAVGTLVIAIAVFAWVRHRPQAQAALPGYVELNPMPWAEIVAVKKIGGGSQSVENFSGKTPLRMSLPPGDYLIELRGPIGTQEMSVKVEPGNLARRTDTLSGFDADKVVDELLQQK